MKKSRQFFWLKANISGVIFIFEGISLRVKWLFYELEKLLITFRARLDLSETGHIQKFQQVLAGIHESVESG
jgi:hypothetical protein